MKPRINWGLGSLLMVVAGSAAAFDIDRLQAIGQRDFRLLSEDVGAAISYHPQTPTEPLGDVVDRRYHVAISLAPARRRTAPAQLDGG